VGLSIILSLLKALTLFYSSKGNIIAMPITETHSQHKHNTLIIFGTLSATSSGKYPLSSDSML
jgi:hypothetical protein